MLIGLNRIKNRIRNKDGWFLRLLLKDIPELVRIHAGDRKIPEQKSTTRGLSGMHSKLLFQRRGCRWVSIERARETMGTSSLFPLPIVSRGPSFSFSPASLQYDTKRQDGSTRTRFTFIFFISFIAD